MRIQFEGILNPKDGYELGPYKCDRCGSRSGALLKFSMWKKSVLLCKKCLNEGEEIINKTILSNCRR
jgi:hypothetical protein